MKKCASRCTGSFLARLLTALMLTVGFSSLHGASEGTVTTDLVKLSKMAPEMVAIGETFEVTYTVEARQNVANIVVSDMVPEGAKLVKSEPQAAVQGNKLTWKVDQLGAGQLSQMKLWLVPTGTGTLSGCATVSAEPRACVSTVVGQPVLTIEKTGPAQALLDSMVRYQITVGNTGDIAATNVVVKDTVPEGLTHESGSKELTFNVGTLAPGESKVMSVPLKAAKRGEFCNKAVVTSGNAKEAASSACTTVVERQLQVTKTGTDKQYIGKTASYKIVVTNPGDLPLTDVVVKDTAPAGTRIVSADGAMVEGNVATWKLATLKAGAKQEFSVILTSREPGTRTNSVAVTSAEGLKGDASAPTLWEGYPALLIEVVDTVDPLQPGEETTYIVTVTNQGSASDRNVKIKAIFPAQISPVSADGDTQTTITGKVLDTTSFPEIKPQAKLTWRIKAKADQAGDSRLRVELTSDLLQKPVTEEESTQVY